MSSHFFNSDDGMGLTFAVPAALADRLRARQQHDDEVAALRRHATALKKELEEAQRKAQEEAEANKDLAWDMPLYGPFREGGGDEGDVEGDGEGGGEEGGDASTGHSSKVVNGVGQGGASAEGAADNWEDLAEEAEAAAQSVREGDSSLPLLLVNVTALFGASGSGSGTAGAGAGVSPRAFSDQELGVVAGRLEEKFASQPSKVFLQHCNDMFDAPEAPRAYHSDTTEGRAKSDRSMLAREFPGSQWCEVRYPEVVGGEWRTETLWRVVSRQPPSGAPWSPAVALLKRCIREAQRDLMWKAMLCEEVEQLGRKVAASASAGDRTKSAGWDDGAAGVTAVAAANAAMAKAEGGAQAAAAAAAVSSGDAACAAATTATPSPAAAKPSADPKLVRTAERVIAMVMSLLPTASVRRLLGELGEDKKMIAGFFKSKKSKKNKKKGKKEKKSKKDGGEQAQGQGEGEGEGAGEPSDRTDTDTSPLELVVQLHQRLRETWKKGQV